MAACRGTPAAFLAELASELAAQPLLPAEAATVGGRARRSASALVGGSNAGTFLVLYALQGMRSVTASTVNLPACFFAVDEAGAVVVVSARFTDQDIVFSLPRAGKKARRERILLLDPVCLRTELPAEASSSGSAAPSNGAPPSAPIALTSLIAPSHACLAVNGKVLPGYLVSSSLVSTTRL